MEIDSGVSKSADSRGGIDSNSASSSRIGRLLQINFSHECSLERQLPAVSETDFRESQRNSLIQVVQTVCPEFLWKALKTSGGREGSGEHHPQDASVLTIPAFLRGQVAVLP